MSWNIEIADAAYQDLRDIYAYIAFELRSPDDARNVLRRILFEIASLDEMPSRFRPYPREPLASQGVRVMDVGNTVSITLQGTKLFPSAESCTPAVTPMPYSRQVGTPNTILALPPEGCVPLPSVRLRNGTRLRTKQPTSMTF